MTEDIIKESDIPAKVTDAGNTSGVNFEPTICLSDTLLIPWQEYVKAQRRYCKEHNLDFLICPDGYCFHCDKFLFEKITLEEAGSKHITGCCFCNTSYCE